MRIMDCPRRAEVESGSGEGGDVGRYECSDWKECLACWGYKEGDM